ncbi:hypothetical protein BDV93DRAFT_559462 [Ceratobasidium sp. AG-I]|nr:hypothetical protein BDV93DRAFT_559462 [Ceratobasidium sp. AG-I]
MDKEFVMWFLKVLVPGPHELDLHFGDTRRPIPGDTSPEDAMISFFQRARVKTLSLQPEGVSLFPLLSSLQHLQNLRLVLVDVNANTFAGLETSTNLLPKLHTIDLNELDLEDYSELPPGLHTLLSLPSVRRIRYLNCGGWYAKAIRKRFVELLEEGGFAAAIIPASGIDFEDLPLPFQ